MPWLRLDDSFPDHPKVDAVGGDAAWLHVCALAYCSRTLTDGFIPEGRIARLSDRSKCFDLVERLVQCGMWHQVEGGYEIHDYLDYNPSREVVEADRADKHEKRVAAGRAGGVASGVARQNKSKREANGKQTGSKPRSENKPPSQPIPLTTGASSDGFDEWYSSYPRKEGKVNARKAWAKLTDTERTAAAEALPAHKKHWETERTATKYIPHPGTWLNGHLWENELATAVPSNVRSLDELVLMPDGTRQSRWTVARG